MALEFLTLPEELLQTANRAVEYLEEFGYTVRPEKHLLEFPYRPTLYCTRGSAVQIVEVVRSVDLERLGEWTAYGRSCSKETRVVVAVPTSTTIPERRLNAMQALGVGVLKVGQVTIELMKGVDLAVNIGVPSLAGENPRVRKALGPAFQQLSRGDWREGFDGACTATEEHARRYLNAAIRSGRVRCRSPKGKDITPTAAVVNKAPMGTLKDFFESVASPNHADAVIAEGLRKLNPDRIRVVHKKLQPRAEAALRKNVGRQIWRIRNVIKTMVV